MNAARAKPIALITARRGLGCGAVRYRRCCGKLRQL